MIGNLSDGDAWPAPAKINLFLHIIGRRKDGYHELQTVFQFLDHSDLLRFEIRKDGVIRRVSGHQDVAPETDLVVRAATALQRTTSTPPLGVDIHIDKRIPIGAGLGGGSSDAATTLVALNRLWGIDMPVQHLAEIGLSLGADVPVFVYGQAAWAEGVGERLTPVQPPQPWYLVIKPNCSVSTAEIFAAADLTRDTDPIKISDFMSVGGRNDCEAVVSRSYPRVAAALDWLGKEQGARLTGTGACVFRPYATRGRAENALRSMPGEWTGFVAKGTNRSPLLIHLDVKYPQTAHEISN